MLSGLWWLVLNNCEVLSNLRLSARDVVGTTAMNYWHAGSTLMMHNISVTMAHLWAWILWSCRRQESAVACSIILGCALPIRSAHSTWIGYVGARVWFPILLAVDGAIGLGALFEELAPACCIIIAFIMWLRGMIKAGLTVIQALECQSCPSWARPPTLVLRRSFHACGTDAVNN